MIDWAEIHIEVNHPILKTGTIFWVDENGQMKKTIDTGFYTDDSSCSKMRVQSYSARSLYSEASLVLLRDQKKFIDNATTSSLLVIKGNPAKFIQQHNVIGTDCLKSLALACFEQIIKQINLPDNVIDVCRSKLANLDFWITRCDITYMFDLGTDKNVEDYLYQLPRTVRARGGRTQHTINTFYVGKNSSLWSLKFYNKFKELNSPKKSHRLHETLINTGLKAFARGKLRIELVLRKKQLDRLKMTYAKDLQKNVSKLFKNHLEKVTMTEQRLKISNLDNLSNQILRTYELWEQGKNPKTFLSRTTFYRHRLELLNHGVDIALVNEEVDKPLPQVVPIQKVLEPKIVSFRDIPQSIKKLCIEPDKSSNLILVA